MQCGAEWQSGGNEDPSEIEKLSGDASAGQLLSCTVHTLNSCLFVCFCGLFVCLFVSVLVSSCRSSLRHGALVYMIRSHCLRLNIYANIYNVEHKCQ